MKTRHSGAPVVMAFAALLAVVGASAQEPGGGPVPATVKADLVLRTTTLELFPREPKGAHAPPLTRWTRLAGMFMGRVDAVRLRHCRVRINLELR